MSRGMIFLLSAPSTVVNGALQAASSCDSDLERVAEWIAFYFPQAAVWGQLETVADACTRVARRRLRRAAAAAPNACTMTPASPASQPRGPAPICAPARVAPRPSAIGALPCAFSDVAFVVPLGVTGIEEWVPPRRPACMRTPLLTSRATAYTACGHQARAQLARVRSWQLHRAQSSAEPAVFAVGAMAKAVRQWQQRMGRSRGIGQRAPPIYVIQGALHTTLLPTPCVSVSGQLWSAADEAPLDERQLMVAMGSAHAAPFLCAMVHDGVVTAPQARALVGQATHGASVRLVVRQLWAGVVRIHGDVASPTVGLVGAGMGLTGLQIARELQASITFAAEGCPRAAAAGRYMLSAAGHSPTWFGRAESPALASAAWTTTVEAVTLRCAPFSIANAHYPRGVEAALRELAAVLRGVRARQPLAVVYENTSGLWRRPELRRRVEALFLQILPEYDWRGTLVSPHLHSGSRMRRRRVFYFGVRQASVA